MEPSSDTKPNPPTDLTFPIPDTDFLATLTGNASISVTDGALLITANASREPDTVNAIIYARFLVPEGDAIASPKPLSGALVRLMDQDVPPPAGDDAVVVVPKDRTQGTQTAKFSFEKPIADQELQRGRTDFDGIVRLEVLKDNVTTSAGQIKEELVSNTLPPHIDEIFLTPVVEAKPDLYFLITMPDGSVADSRGLPGGFMPNFISSRLGTRSNPLTFVLGPSSPQNE